MILQFTRVQVVSFAQNGIMNIKAAFHWDVCNALKAGKNSEQVAEDFRIDDRTVRWIRCHKCPELG